jgi:hypothetical protein
MKALLGERGGASSHPLERLTASALENREVNGRNPTYRRDGGMPTLD